MCGRPEYSRPDSLELVIAIRKFSGAARRLTRTGTDTELVTEFSSPDTATTRPEAGPSDNKQFAEALLLSS
jgi:hypothetical protein